MTAETLTQTRPKRGLVIAGSLAVVAAAVVAAVQFAGDDPPYDDPASTGLLTLCDARGHARTEGRIDEQLASVVLGSTTAPRLYDTRGAVGSLFAFQPREGVEPDEFSGLQLTGSARFASPKLPAARVLKTSTTIGDFAIAFPAKVDGFVQLRLLLSAPGAGTLTSHYDTADLQITGDTWHVVRGGKADCSQAHKALLPDSAS